MGQPEHGLGHRLVVVRAVGVRVVVVERAFLDAQQLRRRQVHALVVGDEEVAPRAPADTVRRAQPTGHIGHFAGVLVDAQRGTAVGHGLRVGGRATGHHGDARGDVEVAVLVQQPERELVVVAAERPGRDRPVLVGDLVAVVVDKRGQAVFLGHVKGSVDVLDAHRLPQLRSDQLLGDLRGVGGAGDVVEQVHLAEFALAGATPGADGQPAVGQPVHAGDLWFEARGAQVGQRVVGVHAGQRQAVARRLGDALAFLAAG